MDLDRLQTLAEAKISEGKHGTAFPDIASHFAAAAATGMSQALQALASVEGEMDSQHALGKHPGFDRALSDAKKAVTVAHAKTNHLKTLARKYRV